MKYLLSILTFLITSLGYAQEKEYLIDLELKYCLEDSNNFSTAKMNECTQIAIEKWEQELVKNFNLLKSVSIEKDLPLVEKAQADWDEYYDSELKSIKGMYFGFIGSMWSTSYLGDKLELIKERAIKLEWQHIAKKGEIEDY